MNYTYDEQISDDIKAVHTRETDNTPIPLEGGVIRLDSTQSLFSRQSGLRQPPSQANPPQTTSRGGLGIPLEILLRIELGKQD